MEGFGSTNPEPSFFLDPHLCHSGAAQRNPETRTADIAEFGQVGGSGFRVRLWRPGMTSGVCREMPYSVYLLSSRRHGTLYLGVTNNLARRVYEHKTRVSLGFTSKYKVQHLVWYETYERIDEAIAREKALKKWRRD